MGPTRLAGLDGLGWLEPWYDADEAAGALSEYRNCEVAVQRAPLRSEVLPNIELPACSVA